MGLQVGKVLFFAATGYLLWGILQAALIGGDRRSEREGLGMDTVDGVAEPNDAWSSTMVVAAPNSGVAASGSWPADHALHRVQVSAPPPPRVAADPNRAVPRDGLDRFLLDWDFLAGVDLADPEHPVFAPNLAAADGQTAVLGGFMSPLDEIGVMRVFLLLEYPAGCFYCLTPSPTGVVLVELAGGQRVPLEYGLVKITGKLTLNRHNPEDFLFFLTDAAVALAD